MPISMAIWAACRGRVVIRKLIGVLQTAKADPDHSCRGSRCPPGCRSGRGGVRSIDLNGASLIGDGGVKILKAPCFEEALLSNACAKVAVIAVSRGGAERFRLI
jgi:hypothetical protein